VSPVPARQRDGREILRGMRRAFGSDLHEVRPSTLPDREVLSRVRAPCGAVATSQGRFTAPESYTPRHLAEKILTSKSALEGERKRVTVLFCDIANSTPLAERLGAEAMHDLLDGFFELALDEIHRYEGTVNQFLGDGFMALFGAPVAHEDDARRAVLAALGILRRLRDPARRASGRTAEEIRVRMGLNTGLVVVGRIGDNLRMDYTAVGDTTNLAASSRVGLRPTSWIGDPQTGNTKPPGPFAIAMLQPEQILSVLPNSTANLQRGLNLTEVADPRPASGLLEHDKARLPLPSPTLR
jgi:class 3 adenylate cyclase